MGSNRIKDLVSIVITNYNNDIYIEECLNSILKQTYKNIEIIIVDDCSTDKSRAVIDTWISNRSKEEKDRIKFLKMIENVGFSGAVTAGLYLAKGEYIAMQDGDDVSHNTRIESEVNFLKINRDIKMVGCNYAIFQNNTNKSLIVPNGIVFGRERVKEEFRNGNSPVSFGTILFRGEVFDEIGGLTRKMEGAEDYEFIAKSLPFGIDNINAALYYYRKHASQRSKKYYQDTDYFRENDKMVKPSVLLVLNKYEIGKTEDYVLTVAKELIEQGTKVTIAANNGPWRSEFEKLNCTVYDVNFSYESYNNSNLKKIVMNELDEILRNEGINLIKVYQTLSGSMAVEAGNKYNIPYMFTISNSH